MRLLTFALLLILSAPNVLALSLDERRQKIITIIDEELNEVERLNKQTGNRNPDHLFRMAELNFEKGRLWRDKENEIYLSFDENKRRKLNKKKYFEKSDRYFKNAIGYCKLIVKKFPNSSNIADVYYILGHDAKENNQAKEAESYLKKSISKSKKYGQTKLKAQISLAETYYNKKYYKKAIPLYENSLSASKDRWWTKDSFNLAWSYYRASQYSKAIDKMLEVYSTSSDSKFIDMRPQVKRDIGLFYATSGKISEGIKFYEKIGVDFSVELLTIAAQLKNEGKFADAQKVLEYAEKYLKNETEKANVYIEQMVLFEKYNRYDSHLVASKKLFKLFEKNILNSNQKKSLEFQVSKMGAMLQKKVASKTYQVRPKVRNHTTALANEYFEMMRSVLPEKSSEYIYLQAETSFADKNYTQAMKQYALALDDSKQKQNNKFLLRSIEAMLFCLTQKGLDKSVKENYYVLVYENLLDYEPKSQRAFKIYEKLFNVYLERKQYDKAEELLEKFKINFPKANDKQEAMIAYLMDVSKKKKDYGKIKEWIQNIDNGKYKVSNKFKKKLRELLTTIQIEDVQNSLQKGDKRKALIGYHQIVKDPDSTERSKINAKYNLAALYYELGSENESYNWSMQALNEMSSTDVKNFSDAFLAISNFLFLKMHFQKSATLSEKVVAKTCQQKTKRKEVAFKNSAFIYLSDEKTDQVEGLLKLATQCSIDSNAISDVQLELLKEFEKQKKWTKFEMLAEDMSFSKRNWPRLISSYNKLSEIHSQYGNLQKSKDYKNKRDRLYAYSVSKKLTIPVEALDIIALEKVRVLENRFNDLLKIKLSFPQKTFNDLVVNKLKILGMLDKLLIEIQDIGSGDAIILATNIVINAYEHVGLDLKNFVPQLDIAPEQKENFMLGFNKAMKENYTPLLANAQKLKLNAIKTMNEYDILSEGNFDLLQGKVQHVRYWSPYLGVTMDKGGQR